MFRPRCDLRAFRANAIEVDPVRFGSHRSHPTDASDVVSADARQQLEGTVSKVSNVWCMTPAAKLPNLASLKGNDHECFRTGYPSCDRGLPRARAPSRHLRVPRPRFEGRAV